MSKTEQFKVGDIVECALSQEECERLERRDLLKARRLKLRVFIGRAAAYMHWDEGYVVVAFNKNGDLKLRGFYAFVSPKDVRLSSQPVCR